MNHECLTGCVWQLQGSTAAGLAHFDKTFYARDAVLWRGISYGPVSICLSVCHKPVLRRNG